MISDITNKRIWRIAYPIILGSIAQNLINVTDTAFLGRLGKIELGAAAIGGVFYLAIIMFGYGLGLGTQIIVARRSGEGRQEGIGTVMEHSLATLVLSSVLIFGLIKFFSPGFFSSIISSQGVFEATRDYMKLRSWGIFFAFINIGFSAFYIGITRTGVITWSTVLMAVINIFLDYVLIFGKMGFPEMGIRGAAAASVSAEMSVTAFFVFYTLSLTDLKKYNLFTFTGFNFELWKRLAGISLPVMIQNFISLAVWFVFFVFVEKMGETQLAISNIIRSVYVILMIPIQGFSSATNTLVSFLIGQGRLAGVLPVIYKTSWLCFLMVMVFVVFSLLMPSEIIGIYTDDPLLAEGSIPVLHVVSGSVICFAFAMVFLYGVSGTGKTQVALIMEMVVITVYLIAAYLFANVLSFSIALVWTVEFIYAILLFLLSFLYLKSGNWRKASRQI